ncbi:Orn/Lys/Arg decarboxylase N-terminal domain-containing protein [Shigella flexneri]
MAQGFQIIWPQNSVDLLKFIEHNPRICGVIFDWDEYSLDLCSDINQLNAYLPLYASSTPTRRWMSACRIFGWRSGFLNMRWAGGGYRRFVCGSTPTRS